MVMIGKERKQRKTFCVLTQLLCPLGCCMHLHSYHEGLQKWVGIGNSGMFRPEMLLPMKLPEDVQVIAWGLSLERWILVSSNETQYAALGYNVSDAILSNSWFVPHSVRLSHSLSLGESFVIFQET